MATRSRPLTPATNSFHRKFTNKSIPKSHLNKSFMMIASLHTQQNLHNCGTVRASFSAAWNLQFSDTDSPVANVSFNWVVHSKSVMSTKQTWKIPLAKSCQYMQTHTEHRTSIFLLRFKLQMCNVFKPVCLQTSWNEEKNKETSSDWMEIASDFHSGHHGSSGLFRLRLLSWKKCWCLFLVDLKVETPQTI